MVRRQVSQSDKLSLIEKRNTKQYLFDLFNEGKITHKETYDFNEGDMVYHNKFGNGQIVKIRNTEKPSVTVEFESEGMKNLYLDFAKLKKL